MTNLRSIIYSKTPLFKSFNNKNIIETECLLGENFLVTKTQNEYSFGKLLTDNYTGWVETNALGNKSETTHRVITLSTNIYLEKTPKSVVLKGLSLGCELHVRRCEQEWAQVLISNNSQIIKAYVPKNHLSKNSFINHKWTQIGTAYLNTPYVWGGRTYRGIDCSALIQLSMKTIGINLPRNTEDQINFMNESKDFKEVSITNQKNFNEGLILFWLGHVGFINKKNTLLHASAFHMKVVEEPIDVTLKRFKGKGIPLLKIFILNS